MDKQTTGRLIHRGTGGQQGWIFSIYGLMATIPSSCYKDPPKILVQNTEMEHKKHHERRI